MGWVAIPVTILWLAGFANIFNFMDGINGISAVTGASYFAFFSVIAWFEGSQDLAVFGIVFAGGCLGFLPHNFPVARTFLGDTGSLLLGFVLGFYVVYLVQRSPGVLLPMILVCSVYLWDSGFTLLCRLRRRENVFHAHRSHLYQRLVQAGQSHARITTLYLILHLEMGSLALACYGSAGLLRAGMIALAALILAAFTGAVYWTEERRMRGLISQDQGRAE
jgi:UDP-N-acetylmuramyl pentapeptide phosphotransferase/UDP-N-acetylglucosamine-1-phosphate transferase